MVSLTFQKLQRHNQMHPRCQSPPVSACNVPCTKWSAWSRPEAKQPRAVLTESWKPQWLLAGTWSVLSPLPAATSVSSCSCVLHFSCLQLPMCPPGQVRPHLRGSEMLGGSTDLAACPGALGTQAGPPWSGLEFKGCFLQPEKPRQALCLVSAGPVPLAQLSGTWRIQRRSPHCAQGGNVHLAGMPNRTHHIKAMGKCLQELTSAKLRPGQALGCEGLKQPSARPSNSCFGASSTWRSRVIHAKQC